MNRKESSPAPADGSPDGRKSAQGVTITATKIEPPKGGGSIAGLGQKLEHNPFNGSAVFEIPIPTPSPRDVSPGLALRYASAAGNGVFGMGFDLDVPRFTRRSATFGIPRYDAGDRFTHSAQGTLVHKLTPGGAIEERLEPPDAPVWSVQAYLPRVDAAFERIEQWQRLDDGTSHWIVQTNSNETQVYGRSPLARIYDPTDAARIAQWLLEESIDALGNRIHYVHCAADAAPGRELTSNRYLAEVAFGNFDSAGVETFNVRVVLDYGGHAGDTPGPVPTAPPEPRPDPFSSYASGFEVRTVWRCRRILVYATHPDLLDGTPVLTRSLTLGYAQGYTGLSMLARIEQRGFRKAPDGAYAKEDLPPLTFGFTPFEPLGQRYAPLEVDNGGVIPGAVGDIQYLPVDFDGEGLAGILHNAQGQILYWPPLGDGRYGAPVAPDRFPSFRGLDGLTLTLASLDGNGRQELVSATPGRAGYFALERTGPSEPTNATTSWAGFRAFETVPSSYGTDAGSLVALNGDGRLDLVEAEAPVVRAYPSLGTRGFGSPDLALMPEGYPAAASTGASQVETYADMFGDGLSHRVRIAQGRVECWPDLGYGNFADRVSLTNAPHYGDAFDAARLFLADLDGSGPADLVYATSEALLIHFNQSGNGFSDPVALALPAPFDSLSRISFADVYGTGATCLVFTRLAPEVKHYVYAFSGKAKPYLLAVLDDAAGNETRFTYTTSVQEYLRDKRAGRPWITQTYFPVQVISEIETIDHIAAARRTRRFAYHDGYYDPALRQFQGFGEVESWDGETFDPPPTDDFVATAYTRSWFHTGAFIEAQAIADQNRASYWHGDPDEPVLAQQWIAPDIEQSGTATLRQAYAALAGQLIRRETYGLDETPQASVPYSVAQATAGVRLIQPKGTNPNAVVQPFVREQLLAEYERDAADPRISHEFVLTQDDYGNVTLGCSVNYPRRPGAAGGPYPYPEQEAIAVVARERAYVVHPGDAAEPYRWIGQQVEARTYELSDVVPQAGLYFDFDGLALQCADALSHPIAYGTGFTPGTRQARLFQWTRGYYWNAQQSAALPLGEIAEKGLAHHGESAAMTPALVAEAFGAEVPDVAAAGYVLDQGYWWNRGLIQYYEKRPGGFSRPDRTDGLFDGVPEDSALNPTTRTAYDEPALFVTAVTRIGTATDPATGEPKEVALTTSVTTDYQASQPSAITDPNGTVTQYAYSPLGLMEATAILGTIDGRPAGDLPLDTRTPTPAPSIAAIAADPAAFLQGSTSYFHNDLLAWADRRQPMAAIEVTRQRHVHQLADGETSLLPIAITYRDGAGRDIEKRIDLGAEAPDGRWAVSDRVRLGSKDEPVETWLAYLAGSPDYADDAALEEPLPPPNLLYYDAVGRLVRELTSKGFLRRNAYAAWMRTAWDENDTILDSPFYRAFPTDPVTPEEKREAAALAQAETDYNTPARSAFDPAGGIVRVLAANLGAITPETLAPATAGQPITPQELWDGLVADGYLEPAIEVQGAAWATAKLQPYVRRCQQDFDTLYGAVAQPALAILKQTGLTTESVRDIEGRVTRLSDPRLFWNDVTDGDGDANFEMLLDMAGNALRTVGADAGTSALLRDIFGNDALGIDGRGIRTETRYDRFTRPVQVDVTEAGATRRAEVFVYGESYPDPASRNLNDRLWQDFDDAGLETTDLYDLAGNPLTPTRRIRTDYARPADWTEAAVAAIEREDPLAAAQEFDVQQRRIFERMPDGSVLDFSYTLAGQVARVTAEPNGETAARTIVESARYNAAGERLRIALGNGVVTDSRYETDTQRLASVTSVNGAGETLQAVTYTYDPVGNVTDRTDASWDTVFCYNQQVDPASSYLYDPLYRLVRGTGRQQAGAGLAAERAMPFCPADPGDREQLENYVEDFAYDDGGNMVQLRHVASRASWTKDLPVDASSNRLADMAYGPDGNLLELDATRLRWDFRERLAAATLLARDSGDDDVEYYLYNAVGERVVRITRRLKQAAGDGEPALYEVRETLFLGDYERTRTFQERSGGTTPLLLEEALTVPDGDGHLAVLERETAQARTRRAEGAWQGRFLLSNQVASVTQEIDDAGARITYREYTPYGATAFAAAAGDADAAASKFRFAGKRRDDATGLYYFGMRYYPPWLARWISPDPAGTVDGTNLYAYASGNPTTIADPLGLCGKKSGGGITQYLFKPAALFAFGVGMGFLLRRPSSMPTLTRQLSQSTSYAATTAPRLYRSFSISSLTYTQTRSYSSRSRSNSGGLNLATLFPAQSLINSRSLSRSFSSLNSVRPPDVSRVGFKTDNQKNELFYRTMSKQHFAKLQQTDAIQATGETFISPTQAFSDNYEGVMVEFTVQPGTTRALAEMGVVNNPATGKLFPSMPAASKGWAQNSAMFKKEGSNINIGLGKGAALDKFNQNILSFRVLRK